VPELTQVSVSSTSVPGGLVQGTQLVVVEPRGEVRLPNIFSLDMSVRRQFRYRGMSFDPRIDFYNLTNEAIITNWLTTLGPTYHRASTVQQGRMIKLGFNFEF
jgi:hypothetical protein